MDAPEDADVSFGAVPALVVDTAPAGPGEHAGLHLGRVGNEQGQRAVVDLDLDAELFG
jgi:hypothetical protein